MRSLVTLVIVGLFGLLAAASIGYADYSSNHFDDDPGHPSASPSAASDDRRVRRRPRRRRR